MRMRRISILITICLALVSLAILSVLSFGQHGELETQPVQELKRYLEEDQCYVCHREEDYLPEHFDDDDIHMQPGVSCAGCHGGDATSDDGDVAMSEEAGFIGVPSKGEIPQFCGRCHSDINYMRRFRPRIPVDQVTQYVTSQHGKLLLEGDDKVADCTSCHTSHAILPASDARSTVYPLNVPETCNHCHGDASYMASYGIPTNQFERYAVSVHGVALLEEEDTGAPACNDCHGNHGALPPEVESVTQVCGQCHVNNMQYFEASAMAVAFEREDFVACEECHGNHEVLETSDQMVGVGPNSTKDTSPPRRSTPTCRRCPPSTTSPPKNRKKFSARGWTTWKSGICCRRPTKVSFRLALWFTRSTRIRSGKRRMKGSRR
jgi:hypothetical protein